MVGTLSSKLSKPFPCLMKLLAINLRKTRNSLPKQDCLTYGKVLREEFLL